MKNKNKLDAYTLKLIACVAMAVNFIVLPFAPADSMVHVIVNVIGKIAFPIYAYLIVEGFFHSSDLKKYMIRLLVLAVITEPCLDFAFGLYRGGIKGMLSYQNAVFTLLIGLIAVYFYDKVITKYQSDGLKMNFLAVMVIFISTFASAVLCCDMPIVGVLMILMFYIFRKNSRMMFIGILAVCGIFMEDSSTADILYSFAPALSLLLIYRYNGEEGHKKKALFYAVYPVLLVFVGIVGLIK